MFKKIFASRLVSFVCLPAILSWMSLLPVAVSASEEIRPVVRGVRPAIDVLSVPDEALQTGIIRIKFSRSQEYHLDHTKLYATPDGIIQFGIPSIDQLNIQFGVKAVHQSFDAALQNSRFSDRHRQWGFHLWYDLLIPQGTDIRQMVMTYAAHAEIEISEPVYRKQHIGYGTSMASPAYIPSGSSRSYTPSDPQFSGQWHYHNTGQNAGTVDADIDLPEAWDIIKGNTNVIVAVLDDGIEHSHPDLQANMWPGIGYNFVNNTSTIIPGDHGTHVAGTIAASTNNNTGVAGIAGGDGTGNGVRLMSCQVFNGNASGGFHTAPVWAADNGAAISQNSWGYTTAGYYEQATLDAIDYFNINGGGTVLNGGITIFSAANNNSPGDYYPAFYSNTLAVAATNNNDQKAYYSNYGSWVDISAPGGETNTLNSRGVLSTITSGGYGFQQGTSMACPHVSGVASLIVSLLPGILTPAELRDILVSTTDNIDAVNPAYTGLMGSGRLNAFNALLSAQEYIIPTSAFSVSDTLICPGSSVMFTDQTLAPVTSWSWSFPGGSPSSHSGQTPPPIQYSIPGSYDVTLTVSDGTTSSTRTKTAYIEARPVIADFSANTNAIIGGDSVIFTDMTECNADTWEWSFPGGTPSSYSGQTPPPVYYYLSGSYDVSITVSKAGIQDTKTITSFIEVASPSVNMFSGSLTSCDALFYDSGGALGNYQNYRNQVLTIYPASAGGAIRLSFNSFYLQEFSDYLTIYDGTSDTDPLIGSWSGFSSPGIVTSSHYTGALTVVFQSDCCGNRPGWSANISCVYAAPLADFSVSNTSPSQGELIQFEDLSSNIPTAWNWNITPGTFNFLNGTSASARNPQVQFISPGAYTITLHVSNSSGSDSITKAGYINVSAAGYCIPAYSAGTSEGDYISLVQLSGISNSSGVSPAPFYTDYSNLSTSITKGLQYTLTLAGGTFASGSNIAAWIDYNQDGVFDPSEKIGTAAVPPSPATGSVTFTVAQAAATGSTRMRVRAVRTVADIDPCAMYAFGETEDYRVLISPVEYCQPSFDNGTMFGNYISLVQLEEINNVTGATPYPSYTFYDGVTANLASGSQYTLTLSAGTNNNNYMSAWIDFNNNSEFEETERLGFISSPESPVTGVITFTVPENAASGTTRMRVIEASLFEYYEYGPCDYFSYGEAEDYPVHISGSTKSLQLTVFLEGLYAGTGTMNQANNDLGPEYGPGIADQLSIEFHNSSDYSIIEHSIPNVDLSINGQLSTPIPASLTGSYYVTIRHRNSIEITSAAPVSFSENQTIIQFDDPLQVFGGNILQKYPGEYVIYGGDVNQDGLIDSSDMIEVDNDVSNFTSGYLPTDVNGDGLIDSTDMIMVDNHSSEFVGTILP